MKTCLVLGGGGTLHGDIRSYDGPVDGVVACNDAGIEWDGKLDAWVSLHPRYFELKNWYAKRKEKGYPDAEIMFGIHEAKTGILATPGFLSEHITFTSYCFPGHSRSGSSGLFAAKVALVNLGFDRAVLCGIPMTTTPHFWDQTKAPWKAAEGFRAEWLNIPKEYRDRMRSMSGWTRNLLGGPNQWT